MNTSFASDARQQARIGYPPEDERYGVFDTPAFLQQNRKGNDSCPL
jgi:hypothetical protein